MWILLIDFFKNCIQSPVIRLEAELVLDFLSPFEDGAFRNAIYLSQFKGRKTRFQQAAKLKIFGRKPLAIQKLDERRENF